MGTKFTLLIDFYYILLNFEKMKDMLTPILLIPHKLIKEQKFIH